MTTSSLTPPQQPAAPSGRSELDSPLAPTAPTSARAVMTVHLSGEPLHLALVPDTGFKPSDRSTATEFRAALDTLTDATKVVQAIADRLMDPLDGETTRGARALIAHRHDLSPQFFERIRGYLYGLTTNGGTLDSATGAVLVPPVPREEFARQTAHLPPFTDGSINLSRLLDHLYDARPWVGQGFYLFETRGDWERFNAKLAAANPGVSGTFASLERLFEQMTGQESIPREMLDRYGALSREILRAQERLLEGALATINGALDPHSRVVLTVSAGDAGVHASVHPFSTVFDADLMRISGHLLTAASLLPADCGGLSAELTKHAAWCRTPSEDPHWGQPSVRGLNTANQGATIDLHFDWAESVSIAFLGDKRCPQMIVAQHLTPAEAAEFAVPPPLSPPTVGPGVPETYLPLVRALAIGGAARYTVISPEETIDATLDPRLPANTPVLNTIERNTRPICTNIEPLGVLYEAGLLIHGDGAHVQSLGRAAIVAAQLREASRPDISTQFLGGQTGELTAHGFALAGAVARAVNAPPHSSGPLLDVLIGYEAIAAVRSSLEGTRERAALGIIRQLRADGALSIESSAGVLRIVAAPPTTVAEAARALQNQLILWQLGLPRAAQNTLSSTDSSAIHLLVQAGWSYAQNLPRDVRLRLREEARREVELFFQRDASADLVELLRPLVDRTPPGHFYAVLATDPALRGLFAPPESVELASD